jgi:hypothetical protein
MLEYIVTIGLVAGAGSWILYPLLKPDQYKTTPVSRVTESLRQLEVKKENTYAAIRELEFDFNMGKLSKTDFDSIERRYRADAVRLIEEIDKLQSGRKDDETNPEADLDSQAEGKIIAWRKNKSYAAQSVFCVQCGTEVSIPGRFCHSCGERLEGVS